ncbi:hypothetical protein EVAR_53665_1 [Eumeta japonica]|uniref:Uncharacterized protein n=1 Tax=Eumeta variegata TaxID=151549 RepID=A0A4C2A3U7_EUMVA|nr:hypothetical protein EVAR_53665_1 [Eumeta japonica]
MQIDDIKTEDKKIRLTQQNKGHEAGSRSSNYIDRSNGELRREGAGGRGRAAARRRRPLSKPNDSSYHCELFGTNLDLVLGRDEIC